MLQSPIVRLNRIKARCLSRSRAGRPEQNDDEDSQNGHDGGAEASDGVEAVRESFAGKAEQRRAERAGELAGCCHGAAEGVTVGVGRYSGWNGVGHLAAINGSADAS